MSDLSEKLELFFAGPGLPIQRVLREGAAFIFYVNDRPYTCCKERRKIKIKESVPEDYMFSISCPEEVLRELLDSKDYSEFASKLGRLKGKIKVNFPRGDKLSLQRYALLGMFEALRRLALCYA